MGNVYKKISSIEPLSVLPDNAIVPISTGDGEANTIALDVLADRAAEKPTAIANNAKASASAAADSAREAAASLASYNEMCEKITDPSGEIVAADVLAQVNKNTACLKNFAGTDSIETFSETKKYVMNDLVVYNQKMYRFKTVHLAGAWSDDDVEVTDMYTELEKLRDQDYENVYVTLSTADNNTEISLAGIDVVFTIFDSDGNQTSQIEKQTDEYGNCDVVSIPFDTYYTISYGDLEGYTPLNPNTYTANRGRRNVHRYYNTEVVLEVEHMKLTLAYKTSETVSTVATTVTVVVDEEESIVTIQDNVAEFDVTKGKTYTVKFSSVDGYIKPRDLTYTAELNHRAHTATYVGAQTGLFWTLRDGSIVNINEWTEEMDVVGLRVATSTLVEAECCFTVPLTFLTKETAMYSSDWGTQLDFECLTNRSNHSQAMNDIDGEAMNAAILDECSEKGYSCAAVNKARTFSDTINGKSYKGFLAAYAQMYILASNTSTINKIIEECYGVVPPQFNSGNWWTASEYNSDYAVRVGNGGFYYSYKYISLSIVPLLAY